MKKLLLIPALLGTMAIASDYNYEISPVIGYNIAEGNLNLDNEIISGLEVQYNGFDFPIKPELSILHSGGVKSEDTLPTNKTNITRFALNGVYDFVDAGSVIPFAKAGIGYETMNRQIAENTDGSFVDAGAGIKVPFTDSIALKLEALYMLKYNKHTTDDKWGDSNLALLAGVTFSFGKKAQPEAPIVVLEVDGDDDNDGVLNSIDTCPNTPAGNEVNSKGCSMVINRDDDNDGVINSMDRCPLTPAGKEVNVDGCCEIKTINLHVNFKFDSLEVQDTPKKEIQEAIDFMVKNTDYNAKIIGYTDSVGSEDYNQALSEKRANKAKDILINNGVSADRLTVEGRGESSPIATNTTKEGRALNRRIEAEITKN